jgi:Na+/H+ antiporter NhaD/arsenite permease-like protein
MENELVALKPIIGIIFLIIYTNLVIFKEKRPQVIWIGLGVLLAIIAAYKMSLAEFGVMEALGSSILDYVTAINWNVLGIFAGMQIIAGLFIESKVPAWLADWLIARSKTVGVAILGVCILSSIISAFVENVATVLIVAPIALAIAKKLDVSPVPFLIGIAISSNLQGTATLIGDPPSMILAGYVSQTWTTFGFNEFFVFQGKPSIFFAVQIGAIASFGILYLFYRRYKQRVFAPEFVKIESFVPTAILIGMIIALAFSSKFDPNFTYLSGVICTVGALLSMLWQFFNRGKRKKGFNMIAGYKANFALMKRYDLETTFFLAGVFIIVFLLDQSGLIADIAQKIQTLFDGNLFLTYTVVVWVSVAFSAFIDNIPYITAMMPVMGEIGENMGGSGCPECYVLVFGLLIGSCLGGNITPIGASANIVSVGLLKKQGYPVSFREFMRIGLPFTFAATLAGYLFIWFVWS